MIKKSTLTVRNIEDEDDIITDEDIRNGKMIQCIRNRNGSLARDKNGKIIPKNFYYEKAAKDVEIREMQQEATKLFSSEI